MGPQYGVILQAAHLLVPGSLHPGLAQVSMAARVFSLAYANQDKRNIHTVWPALGELIYDCNHEFAAGHYSPTSPVFENNSFPVSTIVSSWWIQLINVSNSVSIQLFYVLILP